MRLVKINGLRRIAELVTGRSEVRVTSSVRHFDCLSVRPNTPAEFHSIRHGAKTDELRKPYVSTSLTFALR